MVIADDSAEYYRMREEHEFKMAAEARSEEARHIHLALAENYQALAEEAERRDR